MKKEVGNMKKIEANKEEKTLKRKTLKSGETKWR
jgi:hypothetical protein